MLKIQESVHFVEATAPPKANQNASSQDAYLIQVRHWREVAGRRDGRFGPRVHQHHKRVDPHRALQAREKTLQVGLLAVHETAGLP